MDPGHDACNATLPHLSTTPQAPAITGPSPSSDHADTRSKSAQLDQQSYPSIKSHPVDSEEDDLPPAGFNCTPAPGSLTQSHLDFNSWLSILPIAIPVWDADPKIRQLLRPHLILCSPVIYNMWPLHSASINDIEPCLPMVCRFFSRQGSLRSLTLSHCTLGDPLSCALSTLTLLSHLRLHSCPVTTPYFATRLTPLLHLRTLVVRGCANMEFCVGNALASFSKLQNLEWYCHSPKDNSMPLCTLLMESLPQNPSTVVDYNAQSAHGADDVAHQDVEMQLDPRGGLAGNEGAGGSGGDHASVITHGSPMVSHQAVAGSSYASNGSTLSNFSAIQPHPFQVMARRAAYGNMHNMSPANTDANMLNAGLDPTQPPIAWTFLSSPHLTQLKVGHYEFGSDPHLESRCLSRLSSLQRLCLMYCPGITPRTLTPLASLPNLQVLLLHGCLNIPADIFRHLIPLSHLRSLRLQNCPLTDTDWQWVSALTQLNMLELSMCSMDPTTVMYYVCKLRRLEVLNLSETDDITKEGLHHLRLLTSLAELDLMSCSGLDKEALYCISMAKSLQDLNLSHTSTLSLDGLQHLLSLHSTLHTLNIGGFWPDDDPQGLETLKIVVQLSSLKSLGLGFCFENATPEAVAQLSELRSLTELDLSENYWVENSCLEQLVKITGLKVLDLGGCNSIEANGVKHLTGLSRLQKLSLDFSHMLSQPAEIAWTLSRRFIASTHVLPEPVQQVLALFPESCVLEY